MIATEPKSERWTWTSSSILEEPFLPSVSRVPHFANRVSPTYHSHSARSDFPSFPWVRLHVALFRALPRLHVGVGYFALDYTLQAYIYYLLFWQAFLPRAIMSVLPLWSNPGKHCLLACVRFVFIEFTAHTSSPQILRYVSYSLVTYKMFLQSGLFISKVICSLFFSCSKSVHVLSQMKRWVTLATD